PTRSPAQTRASSSGDISSRGSWREPLAGHPRVVVLDAEDLAPAVAVAGQRGVAVDSRAAICAAVAELAYLAAAAAIPGAVDVRAEPVDVAGAIAEPGSRRRRQGSPLGIAEELPAVVDGLAGVVDRPADVIDGMTVAGAQRKAARVDPGQARR